VSLRGTGRLALLAAGLAAAGFVLDRLDPHALRGMSPAAFVLAGALLCAIGLPRQAVALAAGYARGAAYGTALALLAMLLACALDLAWARLVARDWARRRLGDRLARLDRFLTRRPFAATLTLRLLPLGNNLLLNLAAGVTAVPALRFLTASALGYLPQTIVFALVGSGARVGRGTELLLGALLLLASGALGAWLLRSRPEAMAVE
jgi:uncharacterized membrane protein YdjX (TVP38/TMEM64 family)